MNPAADSLHHAAVSWVNYVFHATWQASALALMVLVAVRFTRRWNSHLRYSLLLLALFKFIMPPFAAVPFGLFSQVQLPVEVNSAHGTREGVRIEEAVGRFSLPDDSYLAIEHELDSDRLSRLETGAPASVGAAQTGGPQFATSRQSATTSKARTGSLWTVFGVNVLPLWWILVHVAGCVAVAVWIGGQHRRLTRLARSATEVKSGQLFGILRSVSQRLGLHRRVRLLVTDESVPPMGFGLVRPVVLLPHRLVRRLSFAEQNSILAHELAHHRRWDQLMLCLQAAVVCFWWFNPLVWLLSRALHRCREECCDDRILHERLTSRDVYSETLARVAEYMAHQERRKAVFTFASSMYPLATRISRVLDPSLGRSGRLSIAGLSAIAVLACFVLPGSHREQVTASGAAATGSGAGDANPADLAASPSATCLDLYGDPLPDGCIARLGTIRFRQSRRRGDGPEVAFVAGGRNLISIYQDNICVWDRDTGKIIDEVDTDGPPIRALAVSDYGLEIATLSRTIDRGQGSGETWLQLWSWHPGDRTIARIWKRPMINVDPPVANCLGFTPDGSSVIVTGWHPDALLRRDGIAVAQFFDAESGEETETHPIAVGQINGIALARTGQTMAIAGRRGVWLWDWATEAEPVLLGELRNRSATAVEFSPDGQLLASLSSELNGVRLWNVKSKQLIRRFDAGEERYRSDDIKFTSVGRHLIVLSRERGVEFWDVATGSLAKTLRDVCPWARTLLLAEEDQWLAVASEEVIQVWNLAADEHLGDPYLGHRASVWSELHFADDGRSVVTASGDGTVRIWDADSGRQRQIIRHEGDVRSVAFSPNGELMASSGMDDTVGIWQMESERRILTVPGHGVLGGHRDVRFSADGSRLYSWGDDLHLRVWDTGTGNLVMEHPTLPSDIEMVPSSHGGYRPAAQVDDVIYPWSLPKSGEFTSDAAQLVVSYHGTLYFYDASSGEEIRKFTPEAVLDTAIVSADGNSLVTRELAMRDGLPEHTLPSREDAWRTYVRVRDYSSLEVRGEIELRGQWRGALAVAPDGKLLAISSQRSHAPSDAVDGPWISIFETTTGREYARIRGFDTLPACLAFAPDAKRLASSHRNTTVLVWDIEHFRSNSGDSERQRERGTGSVLRRAENFGKT